VHRVEEVDQFAVSVGETITEQNLLRARLGLAFEFRQGISKRHAREIPLEIRVLAGDHNGSRLAINNVVSCLVPNVLL
jgi:hypothetical protein